MRILLLTMTLLAAAAAPAFGQTAVAPPPPPPEGPIHIVTYVETAPGSVDVAAAALRAYREATRKETGATRLDVYVETTRANRFLINETWSDFAAYDTHRKASHLAEALKNGHLAPPDSRAHTEWSMGPATTPSASAVFAFTHIDVSPPQLAGLQEILKPLIEKSRADKGNLRFDLLQGLLPRRNHQTLAEAWTSQADFVAHQDAAYAVDFRDKLGPLLGALYDQRLYRLVP
jgi:quinol monooxygenase YgiN